jgi:type I restriction enzyme S subunit
LNKWIPEGWKVKIIDEVTTKVTDGTHSTVIDNNEGDCYLLSCKNIKGGQVVISNKERKIDKSTLLQLRKRTGLQKNDILLTTVGTIGEVAIITDDVVNYELQRSVAIIRPDLEFVSVQYLHQVIISKYFLNQAINRSEGSVQACLFLGAIKSIPIMNSSIEIMNEFEYKVIGFHKKINQNNLDIKELIKLRDQLLPKLISGTIKV